MTFPAKDSIIKRKSVRTFDGKPLSQEDREKLQACIDGIGEPFGVPVDLKLLEAKDHGLSSPVIIGEHTYLAGKVKRQENCEIAFGYAFEKVRHETVFPQQCRKVYELGAAMATR